MTEARLGHDGLVQYSCSIEEAVATEYSDDQMPIYRRSKDREHAVILAAKMD